MKAGQYHNYFSHNYVVGKCDCLLVSLISDLKVTLDVLDKWLTHFDGNQIQLIIFRLFGKEFEFLITSCE